MPSSAPELAHETDVDVGERLRAIRQLRRCTLREVAERAGLSESFLSQIERGRASASIASLQRIAAALGIAVADLFEASGPPSPQVLRRSERPVLSFGVLGRKFLLTPKPLRHLEVFEGELAPGGSTGEEPYAHGDSEELFLVLSGDVELQLGDALHVLHTGDSIGYRSSTKHRIVNVGDEVAEVLWIISPPSY